MVNESIGIERIVLRNSVVFIAAVLTLLTSVGALSERTKSDFERFTDIVLRRTLDHKIDSKADFVGKGLTLKLATKDHSWLMADWDSIAQHIAQKHRWRADNRRARYLRSYQIPDDDGLGYVWEWQHQKHGVYLILHTDSGAGWDAKLVLNSHKITADEAILASYFHDIRLSYRPFEVEKWEFGYVDVSNLPEALNHLGEEFFYRSEYFKPFDGQIVTLPYVSLYLEGQTLMVTEQVSLPAQFTNSLPRHVLAVIESNADSVSANLKVSLNQDGQIIDVIAAAIDYSNGESDKPLYRRAVPEGLLGTGSLPKD